MKPVLVEQTNMNSCVTVVVTNYTLDSYTVTPKYSTHNTVDDKKVCTGLTVVTVGHSGSSSRGETITIDSSATKSLFDNELPILLGDNTVTEQGTTVTVTNTGQSSTVAE